MTQKRTNEYLDPILSSDLNQARIPFLPKGRYHGFDIYTENPGGGGDLPIKITHSDGILGKLTYSDDDNALQEMASIISPHGVSINTLEEILLTFNVNVTGVDKYYLVYGSYTFVQAEGGSPIVFGTYAMGGIPPEGWNPDTYLSDLTKEVALGYIVLSDGAVPNYDNLTYTPFDAPLFAGQAISGFSSEYLAYTPDVDAGVLKLDVTKTFHDIILSDEDQITDIKTLGDNDFPIGSLIYIRVSDITPGVTPTAAWACDPGGIRSPWFWDASYNAPMRINDTASLWFTGTEWILLSQGYINDKLKTLEDALTALSWGAWLEVGVGGNAAYQNNWQGTGVAAPGVKNLSYRKVGSEVWLYGSCSTDEVSPGVVLTLPIGYRPINLVLDVIQFNDSGIYLSGSRLSCTVASSGDVTVSAGTADINDAFIFNLKFALD